MTEPAARGNLLSSKSLSTQRLSPVSLSKGTILILDCSGISAEGLHFQQDLICLIKFLKFLDDDPPSLMLFLAIFLQCQCIWFYLSIRKQLLHLSLNLMPENDPTFLWVQPQAHLPSITNLSPVMELICKVRPAQKGNAHAQALQG